MEKVIFSGENSLYLNEKESEDAGYLLLLQSFDDEEGGIWKFDNLLYFSTKQNIFAKNVLFRQPVVSARNP